MSGNNWVAGSSRAPIFYDSNNIAYYVDPNAATSANFLGSVNAATYNYAGLLVNASGTSSSGAAFAIQQVTSEGWTGIFVDYEPYTGWGLYHDNPNNLFLITAEDSTSNLGSNTVPSRSSGNRTAYTKFAFYQGSADGYAGGSWRAPIFYDSDNAGYYVSPDGTSNMWNVQANNYLYGGYIRSGSNLYLDQNYGYTVVGAYSSYRYQGVFAMGDAYKLPSDGTTTGNLYGIAWSHPNAGGIAGNLNSHGALFLQNGSFMSAISTNGTFSADVRGTIFYDYNNPAYYVDPNGTSVLNVATAYSYQGTSNVAGTGNASYHPSGIYSQGTNWLYGTMYLNNNGIYSANLLSLNNGFQILQGVSNYGYFNTWVDLRGSYGFYSSTYNNAHLFPNDGNYGPWKILGTRSGWSGIEFGSLSNGAVSLMVDTTSNQTGFHNNYYGWQFRWLDGTMFVHKNAYGGGTSASVLDSSNYSSYALPLSGGTMSGTIYGGSGVLSLVIGQVSGVTRGYLYNDGSGFGLLSWAGGWSIRNPYATYNIVFSAGIGTGGADPGGFFGGANASKFYSGGANSEVLIQSGSGGAFIEFDQSSGSDWHFAGNTNSNFYFTQTSVADRMYFNGSNGVVYVPGTLSKGGGSFDIPHPSREGYHLRHSFVEGPRVDLIYRGHVTLVNGTATLNMDTDAVSEGGQTMTPGTFEALTRDADIFVQNLTGWEPLKASIQGATLTIVCKDSTSTDTVSWMVVAERKDAFLHQVNTTMTDDQGRMILEYQYEHPVSDGATRPMCAKVDIYEGL